jgi:tripartite-type tricarboxylate transporter receptor subunit TctC
MAEYPDVPTMAEAGVPDLDVRLWSGLFAPAATPAGIVKKLEREVMEIVKLPDVRERLVGLSVDPAGDTGARRSLALRMRIAIPPRTAVESRCYRIIAAASGFDTTPS